MDRFEIAYTEFAADIDRIEHLVGLVKILRKFGATEGGSDASWVEASDLWVQAKERRTDLPLLSGSLLMYMAGRFEYFVRQTVEIAADEMAAKVTKYSALPDKFREHIKSQTLEVAQNPRRFGFDELTVEGFLQDYVGLAREEYKPTRIPTKLLTITEVNLKARVLADLTKRIGMDSVWKDLGKQAHLKLALDTSTDGETTAEAQSRLDEIMEDRNSLAHPTSNMTFPDPDKILRSSKFLSSLSQALRDLVRVYLVGWSAKSAT